MGDRHPDTDVASHTRSLHCPHHQEECVQGSAAWGALRGRECPTAPSAWSHRPHMATEHLRCDRVRGEGRFTSHCRRISVCTSAHGWLLLG